MIKDYFLSYNEALANDFVLATADAEVELLRRDIDDWRITFVDTGCTRSIGERLQGGRGRYLGDDEMLPRDLRRRADRRAAAGDDRRRCGERQDRAASCACGPSYNVPPRRVRRATASWAAIQDVRSCRHLDQRRLLRLPRARSSTRSRPGEELVEEPFRRLIADEELLAYPLRGLLGADGHAEGQAAPREPATRAGRRRGSVWEDPRHAERSTAPERPRVMRRCTATGRRRRSSARVLAIGAHADDIEIGCGGTLLRLVESVSRARRALGRAQRRGRRARTRRGASADDFLRGFAHAATSCVEASATASSRTSAAR